MSNDSYLALKDMIELQMYLVVQPQQRPWPMLARSTKALPYNRPPLHSAIEHSAGNELMTLGFIEHTSSVTLVVSKAGKDFYEHERAQQSD
jgi:hypothetical protein